MLAYVIDRQMSPANYGDAAAWLPTCYLLPSTHSGRLSAGEVEGSRAVGLARTPVYGGSRAHSPSYADESYPLEI